MNDELGRRQVGERAVGQTQFQCAPVDRIESEPARVAGLQRRRPPSAVDGLPQDLDDGEAFAQPVEQVGERRLAEAGVEPAPQQIGVGQAVAILAGR